MKLDGRSAIITGANQGLGRAIAQHFVEAGAGVLLMARGQELLRQTAAELESLAQRPDQRVLALRGDVVRPEDCEAAVALARAELPGLGILVNNAGIYGPMGPLEEVDWNHWLEAFEINLFGTVHMCRAFIPHLRGQQYGKIINLSGGGATAPLPRISAYAASKAAVVRLTETLAHELCDAHVDVNAIAPGALNTRLLDQVLAAGPNKVGKEFYANSVKQRAEGGAPLARGADLAVYLASAASDGISGRLFSAIWDDWPRLAERREALAKSDIYTLRRITPEDRGQKWQCA
jgi:NAD(P)-dependent dehydrogenase (short-subunit alcohol dehydrogenase family)